MSVRQTPETQLISAVINSGDPYEAKSYGIIPTHIVGCRDEYQWVMDYVEQYGTTPTAQQFKIKFNDFPYDDDVDDARWPAQEVKRAFASRDLLKRCHKAVELISRGQVEEAYAMVEEAQLEIVTARPNDALVDPKFLDDYDDEHERTLTPWPTLNKLTNGIGPGELWYMAARQGNGKSSYLVDMSVDAAFNGKRVCFYSMEMSKRQVQVRAHAAMAHRLGIDIDEHAMLHRTYDKEQYRTLLGRIEETMGQAGGAFHIHVPSMGKVSPGVVASLADEYDLHMIDYIGLMFTDDGQPVVRDWRQIAEVSNSLKQIALAKETSVWAASQINREGATVGSKPPKLHQLAQSDHLGNDGDVVLTMKRYGQGAGIFSVEKNRHGPSLSLFYTAYDPNKGNFQEINSDRANQIKDESDVTFL